MPAPKGNRFWKQRSKHGRDALFTDAALLWEAAQDYFAWCDKNPLNKKEPIKSGERAGKTRDVPTQRPYFTIRVLPILRHLRQLLAELQAKRHGQT